MEYDLNIDIEVSKIVEITPRINSTKKSLNVKAEMSRFQIANLISRSLYNFDVAQMNQALSEYGIKLSTF